MPATLSTVQSPPEVPEEPFMQSIVNKVSSAILESLFSGTNVKNDVSLYARLGSIATQMVTFFSSFALTVKLVKEAKGCARVLLYITPISSLMGLCMDIFSLLWDLGKLRGLYSSLTELNTTITSSITSFIETISTYLRPAPLLQSEESIRAHELVNIFVNGGGETPQSNALSPTQMIGLATSVLLMFLVGASSLIGWNITEINQFLRLRYQTFSAAKDLKETIIETLSAMGLCDVTGKASMVSDVEAILETTHSLKLYPLEDFILDPSKFSQLLNVLKSIKDIQKKALNSEVQKALSNFLVKLDKDYCQLLSVYKQVTSILSDSDRQNCIGIILEGDGGVGKSHMAKHLLKQWGKAMGYGESIYDLSRGSSHRFNKPYAFQSLGIFNEFGAQRAEAMDYLEDINKILSSDPFGFESASEELKYQPCKLKVVIFTSNVDKYDFTKAITEPTNIAMMSRFIRVQVRDKDYEADRNSTQSHRKPDYSHLECQIVKPVVKKAMTSLSDCWNVEGAYLTPKELENHVLPILAMHEKAHLEKLLEKLTDNAELTATINQRIVQLNNIISDTPRKELEFKGNKLFKSFHKTSGNKMPMANASEPLVFHFAGPIGVGKSERALQIAMRLRSVYNLKVQKWDPSKEFPNPTIPSVFIFNDYPFDNREKAQSYLNFVDNITPESVVIITSNFPFETMYPRRPILEVAMNTLQDWWFNDSRPLKKHLKPGTYWANIVDGMPGLCRRIGLPFRYDALSYIPRASQQYVEFDSIGIPSTEPPSESSDLSPHCCQVYTNFVRTNNQLKIINSNPPIDDFDVVIKINDFQACLPYMQTQIGLLQLRNGVSAGNIIISNGIAAKVSNLRMSEWLMPEIPDHVDLLALAKCYCQRLRIVAPTVTVQFRMGDVILSYLDGHIYTSESAGSIVRSVAGKMYVADTYFPPSEFAQYYCNPVIYTQLKQDMSFLELEAAKEFFEDNKQYLSLYKDAINYVSGAGTWTGKFWKAIEFCKSTVGFSVITAIFSVTAIFGLYRLCKKFFGSKPDIIRPNSAGSSLYEQYPNLTGAEIARMQEIAAKRVLESNWRTGSVNKNAIQAALECKNSLAPLEAIISQLPPDAQAYLRSTKPNAVAPDFENAKLETSFSSAVKAISKNLCKFSGKLTCYGIFLKRDLCVVPLHSVDLENQAANRVFWAPTESSQMMPYEVKILAYTSKKDICILRAINCPAKKDITNLLPTSTSTSYTVTAAYVRPFMKTEICWGIAHYNPVKAVPLSIEDQFHPIDYVHFDQIMFGARAIYQIGDCGLPLIGLIENKAVLLGFHIALNSNDEGWFSSLHYEDLKHLEEPTKNATFPNCVVPGFQEHADVPSWNGVLSNLKNENPFSKHHEIPVLGTYSTGFSISPSSDKKCLYYVDLNDPLYFPLETAPAPTRTSMLCSEARELLPKLDNGTPSALLAQVKKYYMGMPFQPQERYFEHAIGIEKQLFQIYFGTQNKPLRLHEVINGILGSSLKHLVMSTSAGPSMKLQYKITNKNPLFHMTQANPPVYGININTPAGKKLSEDYYAIIECWSAGSPTTVIVKDNPKVEILDQDDVKVGKIRQFCELDLALNMALRRYFGSIFDKMAITSNETPWKISWNPYFMPHHIVAMENEQYDIICIDVKRMDKNLSPNFVSILCGLTASTYAEDMGVDFQAIAKTMSRAIHAQGNVFYTQEGGNHSGSALTTPLNTISCHLCMLYVFIKQFNKVFSRMPTLHEATTYMTYAGMGDDVRVAFNPTLKMTFEILQEGFKECGLEIVLNKNTKEHTKLGELCSRIFRQKEDSHIVYGALKKKSILKTIHWVKKSKLNLFPQIAGLAIFEASLWEEEFFNKVVSDSVKIAKRHGLDPTTIPINTYKEYRHNLDLYILGQSNSPIVTSIGNGIFDSFLPDTPPVVGNPQILKWHVEHPDESTKIREFTTFDKNTGNWVVRLTLGESSFVGSGTVYCTARGQAYSQLLEQ